MAHRIAVAFALVGVMSVLRAVAGCSTSNSQASNSDASEDDGACATAGGSCITGSALKCPVVGPQSCGARSVCCLVNANSGDAGAGDAGACPQILASNYDQSCTTDSDCVVAYVGNPCSCEVTCGTTSAAINKSDEPQYLTDIRNLPPIGCACQVTPPPPEGVGPCCIGGSCQFAECPNLLAGDAAADTGASDGGKDGGALDASGE